MSSLARLFSLATLIGSVLVIGGTGCRSWTAPPGASFANVTIKNHSTAEIAAAAAQVFSADGYRGSRTADGDLLFEKEASRATTLARESMVAAYGGAQTINRVRAQIVGLGGGTYRLQCKAYMVTGGSDPFFQDEVPLANVRSAPYQALLEKVAKQLK